MGCVGRLSSVELDIFLTSASPDQRAIVRTLRDIITRRAGNLAERVNKDKELTGYLLFEGPGNRLVFAIGLTGVDAISAVADATPGYLGVAAAPEGRTRRWGRRRQADG